MACLLSSCAKQDKDTLPGYLEAQYTFIATGTSGTLKTLLVSKGQSIKKGQLLCRLTPEDKNAKEKRIEAPLTGTVFDVYFTQGEYVPATSPILSILDPTKIKIIFYASMPSLHQLKLNQSIDVTIDSTVPSLKAKIIYISPQAEYTPPVIYSNEEKNKLVYRIEALPVEKNDVALHPGQPVTVHTRGDHA